MVHRLVAALALALTLPHSHATSLRSRRLSYEEWAAMNRACLKLETHAECLESETCFWEGDICFSKEQNPLETSGSSPLAVSKEDGEDDASLSEDEDQSDDESDDESDEDESDEDESDEDESDEDESDESNDEDESDESDESGDEDESDDEDSDEEAGGEMFALRGLSILK